MYVADPTLTATDLMVQHSKVKPEDLDLVKQGFAKGGIRQAAKLLTPEMIDEFSIAGTPDECLGKLERLAQLGIQIPIAFDILGPNPEVAIELISKEIEPRLLAGR